MSRSNRVKFFVGKVAVVHGASCPLATSICLKLIEHGARLLLVDDDRTESAASLSHEMNLLWGGADSNYDEIEDPWGAKLIAKHLRVPKNAAFSENVHRLSLNCFGKLPEFLVDASNHLSAEEIHQFVSKSHQEHTICIQPLNSCSLWSYGWLGCAHSEHQDVIPSLDNVNIYTKSSGEVMQRLMESVKRVMRFPMMSAQEIWLMKSDNLIWILAYFLHSGMYVTASDFRVQFQMSPYQRSESDKSRSSFNGKSSLLIVEKLRLNSLLTLSLDNNNSNRESQVEQSKTLKSIQAVSSNGSDQQQVEPVSQEMDEDKDSATVVMVESDARNNGTFDALLQKAKDYPMDWWQDGHGSYISVDDINCTVMARAAVHFAFRWVILGYLVIGVAVPKVLGWNNP